ncbi:MAG TPA: hypothetical protein VK809_12125 [Bacteroidia bacterium]|jgi:hypothetical protein|nr:hypothetical protein [Bacteroidia bacterium]
MKRGLLLLVSFVLGFNLYSQSDTSYIHTFGGIQDDGCKQIQATPDGGYITIGTTNSFGVGNTDFYVIKTDSLCNFKWSRTYGGPLNDEGFSVTNTRDGGYAFVGFTDSYGAGGYDVFLVKTDGLGNVEWQKTYGGSNWDFGYSVQQTNDGGFVICGLTYSYGNSDGDVYIIRTNSVGDTLWTKTFGGQGYDVGNQIAVRHDSLYIIAGATTSYGVGDTNAMLLQINDKGTIEWTKTYGGDSNNFRFNSVHLTPDNALLMYGSTDSISDSVHSNSYENEYFLKTDTFGVPLVAHDMDSPQEGFGADARQLADGTFITMGSNESYGAGQLDFHIYHLNSSSFFIAGPTFGGVKNEMVGSMAFGKNGDVVFAGSSNTYPTYSAGLYDVFIVRVTSTNLFGGYDTVVTRFIDTTQWLSSIPKVQFKVGVTVFPNAVSSLATILVQGSDFEKYAYNMYDINGNRIINNAPLNSIGHGQAVAKFERGNIPAGEYLYEIISNGSKKVASGKLIIE